MTVIAFTSVQIRALTENGAIVRPHTAGGAITIGHAVYVAADGEVEEADANAGTPAEQVRGIAIESYDGETSVAAGNPVSVCVFGPVSGFSGMTPGDTIYLSETVGRADDAAGAFSRVIGHAESATVLWVNPEQSDAASS